jgi:hypothetical protein
MKRISLRRAVRVVIAVAGLSLLATTAWAAERQRTFPTPDAAMAALSGALGAGDMQAMLDLFGHDQRAILTGGDEAAARVEWRSVRDSINQALVLRPGADGRMIAVIGHRAWPFPFPLVQSAEGWRFDTEAGIEEITDRRIGRNELAAISVARAYIDAQRLYAAEDRDGDRVLEYAQRLISTPNQKDGLYWPAKSGEPASPFGPYISEAADFAAGRKLGDPYQGYYFRVLTRQGAKVPGGAYDFVINGNMIAGFALVAWPADYGTSGIMSFLASHHGDILEKDLGPETERVVAQIKAYDPDETWVVAGD